MEEVIRLQELLYTLTYVYTQFLSWVQLFVTPLTVGSSVHGISQARTLEWVVISFSSRTSQPRKQTRVSGISCNGRQILYH